MYMTPTKKTVKQQAAAQLLQPAPKPASAPAPRLTGTPTKPMATPTAPPQTATQVKAPTNPVAGPVAFNPNGTLTAGVTTPIVRTVAPTVGAIGSPTAPRPTPPPVAPGTVQPRPPAPPGMPTGPTTASPVTPVTPAPAPPPPPAGPATADDIDQMLRDLVAERMRGVGNADTTEQEELLRELAERKLGGDLVGQRARMGRAGFGSSGALAGIEGDTRRAAGLDVANATLDLRRTEDQRAYDNALSAYDAEQGARRGAADDELRRLAVQGLLDESMLDASPEERAAQTERERVSARIADGADTDGDGRLSPAEEEAATARRLEGHQAFQDHFAEGGTLADLPRRQGPGGGFEVVYPPGTDREGNPKPGQLYNRSTGEIAIYG